MKTYNDFPYEGALFNEHEIGTSLLADYLRLNNDVLISLIEKDIIDDNKLTSLLMLQEFNDRNEYKVFNASLAKLAEESVDRWAKRNEDEVTQEGSKAI